MNERSVFLEALEIADENQRQAYLDAACRDNAPLRQRVETLLATEGRLGDFLAHPHANAADAEATTAPVSETPGASIGSYKLIEKIGEGGFGLVFVAEQHEPVRRKVALKVIKPGMDTREVIARFEAERQALAIMDHPNIAKVFGGGTTPSGRPYFVMELVKGVPITEFCDQNHLTPRQRLELFITVCQAVQHAHQKGIIHRDLKPTNVLVSRHDTTPVVKVIDFGVAKALGQELTDKTLYTGINQMVGTPLYMSPEQAGMSDLDVDTRSDIYSLGVLLYELLTGATPFTKERFKRAAYDEIRRIIREEDPPKPSTRLSGSETLPSIAANRSVEPARLQRLIRGELDWIVMKALEKDRSRRYETANGLALDVQRHLTGEPVLAVPPSFSYRLRKFVRKNRGPVLAAAVLLVALLGGVIGTTIGMVRAGLAERDAQTARTRAERERDAALAARKETFDALMDLTDSAVQSLMLRNPEPSETEREFLQRTIGRFERLTADLPSDNEALAMRARCYHQVGDTYGALGEFARARDASQRAVEQYRQLQAISPVDPVVAENLLDCLNEIAVAWQRLGDPAKNVQTLEAAVIEGEAARRKFPNHCGIANQLAGLYANRATLTDGTVKLADMDRAIDLAEFVLGRKVTPDERGTALAVLTHTLATRALHHANLGNVEATEADTARVEALEPPQDEIETGYLSAKAYCYEYLSLALANAGRHDEAIRPARNAVKVLEAMEERFPSDAANRSQLVEAYTILHDRLRQVGQTEEAERYSRAILALQENAASIEESASLYAEMADRSASLAQSAHEAGRKEEANQALDKAVAYVRRALELSSEASSANPAAAHARARYCRAVSDAAAKLERWPETIDFATRQLDLARTVEASGKRDADLFQLLMTGNWHLTKALFASGRQKEARAAWQDFLRVVAWSNPGTMDYWACDQLSVIRKQLLAAGVEVDPAGVLDPGIAERRAQLAKDPTAAQVRTDLRRGYRTKGLMYEHSGRFADAIDEFNKVLEVGPPPPESPDELVKVEREIVSGALAGRSICLDALGKEAEAEASWAEMYQFANAPPDNWFVFRTQKLLHNGQPERAVRLIEETFLKQPVGDGGPLYNAACMYALASTDAKFANRKEELSRRAVALLAQVKAAGYFADASRLEHAKNDKDLDSLRGRDDFQRLFAEKPAASDATP